MANLSEINYQKIQDIEYRIEKLKAQLVGTDNSNIDQINTITAELATIQTELDTLTASIETLDTDKASIDLSNMTDTQLAYWREQIVRQYHKNMLFQHVINYPSGDYTATLGTPITLSTVTITFEKADFYFIFASAPPVKVDNSTIKFAIYVDDAWYELSRSNLQSEYGANNSVLRRVWVDGGTHIISIKAFTQDSDINFSIPARSATTFITIWGP